MIFKTKDHFMSLQFLPNFLADVTSETERLRTIFFFYFLADLGLELRALPNKSSATWAMPLALFALGY
jgi:hypothetical protein